MIKGIDVVFIHVQNPRKMAKWYQDILGVKMGFRTPDLHWQEFDLPIDRLPTRFGFDSMGEDVSEVETQKIVISFGVDEIFHFVEELERKGLQFFGDPKIIDAGPTLFATTKDPEGNWIQFSQKK